MQKLWPCCDRVGADITVLREREVDYDSDVPRKITEVLVRKVPDNQQVSTYPSLPFTPMLPEREGSCLLAYDTGGTQCTNRSPGSSTALDPTFNGGG